MNFSNGQSGSDVQLDLPAGGAVFMETDGQGEIETGAARVTSTVPVGVTAVLRLLDAAGNVTVEAGVGDSLPLHALTVAVDTTSGFDTGVALFNHNPEPANVTFFPWDKDLSFGSHYRGDYSTANDFFAYEYGLAGGWGNLLISKALATPELLAVIHTRLETLMEEHFPPEWYFRRIDELTERIEGSNGILPGPTAFVAHPRNHHGPTGRFHDQVESLRDFVELRRAFIQSQLAAGQGLID